MKMLLLGLGVTAAMIALSPRAQAQSTGFLLPQMALSAVRNKLGSATGRKLGPFVTAYG